MEIRLKKNVGFGILTIVVLTAAILAFFILRPKENVDFSSQIKPILNDNCISCHGGVKKNGGFSLLFEKEALADTKSGKPAIIPGDASGSELIRRIKEHDPEFRMPFERSPLSKEEIDLLTRWVNQGAKWGKHWAYSLPEKVAVPSAPSEAGFNLAAAPEFLKNNIDNFVLARMGDSELEPNGPAKNNVLARRVAFDITGLPPNADLVNQLDNGSLSYENLVDSLLARQSYGEKWASWWLDLARYADSKGYEKDMGRSIWEYRDWVIRALNNDMPYDQFTIEQLAGDLLPQPSNDQLIATAFHRNTMNNDEGGTDDEEFRVATVIDRVNTTFSVWQSTTMECVQCHSHPYDPFKHEDYYGLMAFFNNTRDEDTPDESPVLKFYNDQQQLDVNLVLDWVSKYGDPEITRAYSNFLRFTEPVYKSHIFKDFKNGAYDDHASVVLWDDGSCVLQNAHTKHAESIYLNYNSHYANTRLTIRENGPDGEILTSFKLQKTKGRVTHKFPFKKINKAVNLYIELDNNAVPAPKNIINIYWVGFLDKLPESHLPGANKVEKAIINCLNQETPTVPIMWENPKYMKRSTQLFERGNWLLKGDTLEPTTPEILGQWNPNWSSDRLGLSSWIVSKNNPLTARTLVNRVWHQIFGRGLVATVEDIGSQSDPPSHPALLDWLALRFMNEHKWSIKSLVKEIVTSGTYRQSSESNPEMYSRDPENMYYARGPRMRLSAEQIRDQALAVSGLLSSKMYGASVMPPQPDGVWQTVYNGAKWEESEGEDKYRRALYTYLKRTSPYPSFLTFDAGSREVCTIRRTVTNTPLQALVTLNDPVYLEAAYNLAQFSFDIEDLDKSIITIYETATYSKISEQTFSALKELYTTSFNDFNENHEALVQFLYMDNKPNAQLAAMTVVANAVMNLDEFLTKA